MVDMEVIEAPCRAVTPETSRIPSNPGTIEETGDAFDIILGHRLLDAIGAEARDSAGDVDPSLVERVAEVMAGVAADDQRTGLAHECAHMPDRTANDNGDALHRDAAARTGVALNNDEP